MKPKKQVEWYTGKTHKTISNILVRSKQELLIADLFTAEGIVYEYERRLTAKDGTFRYPDFTLFIYGKEYYWEHWGRKGDVNYERYKEDKLDWYEKFGFMPFLIQTFGGTDIWIQEQTTRHLHKILYTPSFGQKQG